MISRRELLYGVGASSIAAACGGGKTTSGPDAGDLPPEPDAPAVTACTASSSMTPAELLAHVETIVVLCMENRSFDHYLGSLQLAEGRDDIEGLTGSESNPSSSGGTVTAHQLQTFTPADPPHDWDSCHAQWDNGANDGFVKAHAGASEADVMGYHVRAQIPVTYALADAGVVCNRWHAGCLGPTWPNRLYLHGGTSKGSKTNVPVFGFTSIFDRLRDQNVTGTNYYSDVAFATGGYGKLTGLATIERFFEDAMAGNLPPFAILDPSFTGGGANDDHPDHDIRMGQALIASIVRALGQSPQWSRCLFVLTYDEHGGFFDHVAPPAAPLDADPEFRQLGFRVPTLVLGPTVRRGCARDDLFEHSSVAATATLRYGLEPLNARAAAAQDLSPCIDPRRIGDPLPPPTVPQVTISRRELARRQTLARQLPPTHPELHAAIDALRPPRGLDRRADADAIAHRVLAWGERLGAVRIID